MDVDVGTFAEVFVTLLVIMDPIGNVPVFLALTRDAPDARARSAWQAGAVAMGVILVFAFFGQGILRLLGISIESLQVAGGLLLLLVALELLGGHSGPASGSRGANVALVPLGTPLLAGPGAIAATMVFVRRADGVAVAALVVAALVAVVIVVAVALRFGTVLARALKESGIQLLTRIMGLLLAAIAVQLVAEAIGVWVMRGVR